MVGKTTRRCLLLQVTRNIKLITSISLKTVLQQKRLKLAEEYMKRDLSTVMLTAEYRVTHDAPDGWSKV